ncbi:hypothetical protein A3Q56_01653 [Intoshia linei]|uniref:Uncharacterized protein n=1 Tax=Intoshia linei TaxID=1819745 RepID=A0A177B8K0_9BILA|nr:hypothetical protein A3Q56_01653 [Intoshia linei]
MKLSQEEEEKVNSTIKTRTIITEAITMIQEMLVNSNDLSQYAI